MTLDNLTQLQKIAIEGEVSSALNTAKHNPEILYRIYVMLKNAPKEIAEYIIEIVRNITDIREETLNRVLLEVSAKTVPVWLWIDRTIADIKLSITLAEADGMICKADLDKKLAQKNVVKSAFVSFCRSAAIESPEAAKELCLHILNEEPLELDFLSDTCFALIEEINELVMSEKIPEDIIHRNFDIRNILSYKVETQVLDKINNPPKRHRRVKKQELKVNTDLNNITKDSQVKLEFQKVLDDDEITVYAASLPEIKDGFLSEAVSHAVTQILNEQLKTDKAKKVEEREEEYAVIKQYNGSDISSTLRTCKTEAEAEEFKGKLEKQFPELMKTCTIKIKKVK